MRPVDIAAWIELIAVIPHNILTRTEPADPVDFSG